MKKLFIILLITLFSYSFALTFVVNESVSAAELTALDLQKIYLGKVKSWPDGAKVVPFDIQTGEAKAAMLAVINKSSMQYDSYWKQQIFSGQGVPPKSFATEAELIAAVKSTPGAIGYIDGTSEGMKIITITE